MEGRDLYLIMADPTNIAAADAIAFHTSLKVKPVVAPESEVVAGIEPQQKGVDLRYRG